MNTHHSCSPRHIHSDYSSFTHNILRCELQGKHYYFGKNTMYLVFNLNYCIIWQVYT